MPKKGQGKENSGAGRKKGCEAPRTSTQRSLKHITRRGTGRNKGCVAPRVEDTAQRYRKPEAHDAQTGWAALRVQSTEDEHAVQQKHPSRVLPSHSYRYSII